MNTLRQDDRVADEAPWSDRLTAYDEAHLRVYMRMLDAKKQGAQEDEVCRVLFNIDPAADPARARKAYETRLRRAVWMTECGYLELLRS